MHQRINASTNQQINGRSSINTSTELCSNQLSDHLFWDIAQGKIDSDRNARWLIQRVLEYGQWSDWKIIENYYGVDRIGVEMTKVRTLEPRALSFIVMLSGIPLNQFRCYTRSQLNQKHWSY